MGKERMIHSWHQDHFRLPSVTADILAVSPLRCPAKCCANKVFQSAEDLLEHLKQMGVHGASDLELKDETMVALTGFPTAGDKVEQAVQQAAQEETAPIEPYVDLGKC